jgi:hypothetical protein
MVWRLLFLLQHAFMGWMLWDCYQRRAGNGWYWIIFIPFGEWFYFFKVKIHDPDMMWLKQLFHREKAPKLEHLRYMQEETPSLTNRLRYGQALHDEGEFEDASGVFQELAADDGENLEARYGLARCQMALGQHDEAVESFESIIEAEPSFSQYEPWLDLAKVLWQSGRQDESVACLEDLVAASPRLAHSVTLAQFQKDTEQRDGARSTLREALHHFDHAPKYFRKRNRMWAFRAKRMLKSLG